MEETCLKRHIATMEIQFRDTQNWGGNHIYLWDIYEMRHDIGSGYQG